MKYSIRVNNYQLGREVPRFPKDMILEKNRINPYVTEIIFGNLSGMQKSFIESALNRELKEVEEEEWDELDEQIRKDLEDPMNRLTCDLYGFCSNCGRCRI